NNGDGTFNYNSVVTSLAEISRPFGGWGVHVLDYDNDEANEIFFANSHVMDNIEITQPNLRYLEPPLLLKYLGGKFVAFSKESGVKSADDRPAEGGADAEGDRSSRVRAEGRQRRRKGRAACRSACGAPLGESGAFAHTGEPWR